MNDSQRIVRQRRLSRKQLETVAFHEAGHAVVRFLIGYVLEEVAIFDVPNDAGELGHAQGSGCCEPYEEMLALLAGTVAQAMFLHKPFSFRSLSNNHWDHVDVLKVSKAIHDYKVTTPQQGDVILAHIVYMAALVRVDYLEPYWQAVQNVAAALLQTGELSGDEIEDICRNSKSSVGKSSAA